MDTTTNTAPQIGEQNKRERTFKILNLSVPVFLGIFIFLNPFPHTTAIKEICFYGSVFIVFLLFWFKKIDFSFKSPLTLPLALFVLWTVFGLFFAFDKENSIHDFWAHLLKYIVLYYMLINFFSSKKRFEILTLIIIVSAGVFSIGGIIYFYEILNHSASDRLGFEGVAAINNVGFIVLPAMLLSLVFFIKEKKVLYKIVLFVFMLGTLAASLLTQTIGILLSIVVPLLILFVKNKKTAIIFLFFLIFAVALLPVKNRLTFKKIPAKLQSDCRRLIWHTYFQIIKDHSIIGVGFGMTTYFDKKFIDKYDKYKPKSLPSCGPNKIFTPHNMFIDITARLGVIGLVLFLYTILTFTYMGYIMIKRGQDVFIRKWALCLLAVMAAYVIQGMFADILFGVYLIILYAIFALMTILWKLNSESDVPILRNQ
jgi:O-antigen ligase